MNATATDTTTQPTTELERYVAAVSAELGDLAAPERDDLLDDLRQHLAEVAAESTESLAERLGPPAAYAAELRASAGLGPAQGRRTPLDRLLGPTRRLRTGLADDPRAQRLASFAAELRPGWWVLRGYLAALCWSLIIVPSGAAAFPVPRFFGSRVLGMALALGLIAASVWLGRGAEASPRLRRLGIGVSVLVVLLALPALAGIYGTPRPETVMVEEVFERVGLRAADGAPITNLYPYDAAGNVLTDVRLFDQHGRPLELIVEFDDVGREVITSYPLTAEGAPVTNAFPQRQALRDGDLDGHGLPPFGVAPDVELSPLAEATPTPTPTGGMSVSPAPSPDRPAPESPGS